MIRKRFEWKIGGGALQLGDRTLIMGVLNVTPDSFSDGGKYQDPDRAYARAIELEDLGADILDIGAESTRPGSQRVSEHTEIERLSPVLKRLREKLRIPISVDTYKPGVAEFALAHGAEIINDPTGLTWEPDLAKVVIKYNAGLILNHMRGTPETWAKLPSVRDVGGMVANELESAVHRAVRAGVELERIMIDPGLGFGKRKEQNAELIARLGMLGALNVPILVGPSRKSFLARPTEEETRYANAAAVTAAILAGAHVVRVHEVKEMRIAAQLADAILTATPVPEAQPHRDKKRGDEPGMRSGERGSGPPSFGRDGGERSDAPRFTRPPATRRPADQPRDNPPPAGEPERPHASRTDRPPFAGRPSGPGDRPPASRRPSDNERDNAPGGGPSGRPYNRGDRPPFAGRPSGPGDRPPAGRRPSDNERDNAPGSGASGRPYNRGDRPPFAGRPSGPGDRPPAGRRPSDNERENAPGGGQYGRPYNRGDRPPFGGRPPRPSDRPPAWRRPSGDERENAPGGGQSDRPYNRGDRPPFAGRPPRPGDRPPFGRGPGARGPGRGPGGRGPGGKPPSNRGPRRGDDFKPPRKP